MSEFEKFEVECNNRIEEEHTKFEAKYNNLLAEFDNIKIERDDLQYKLDKVNHDKSSLKKENLSLKEKINEYKHLNITLEKEIEKLNDIRNIQSLEESLREVSLQYINKFLKINFKF